MRRCYGCMQEFADEFELCPHCGFIVGTAQEVKSHLPCGTKLSGGRYVVGKVLGYGGFGITYIAWDTKRNRRVAVKEFFPNALSTRSEGETVVSCYNSKSEKFFKEGVRKMLDEGERLSKFHKNESIVNVYDFFEANKTAYIVMEYLEGKDLKKYLEENGGKLDADEAIEIMLPVLNALNEMHKENLIHRDISPDNIFICNNGKVKILDFGSARLAVADSDKSMSIMLKKGYAPKEQYSSHSKQGPWTDVYAASATLYELVTGHKPVDSMDRDEEPLKTFKELGVLGMGELEGVIVKGMAQDVAERTPDAATLYAELAELIKPAEGGKPDFIPRPPQPKTPSKPKKSKKPLIIAAVIAVVVAVGALGGKFAWDRFSAKPEESTTTTTASETETTTETTEITTEAPMLSEAVPYEFKNGETTVTEKLNTILGDNENVFMADINGDKNSEVIVIKESDTPDETGKKPTEVFAYTTLADGNMIETKLFCDSSSQFLADTTGNALYVVTKGKGSDKKTLYTAIKYTVSETGFQFIDKISATEPKEKGDLTAAEIIEAVEKEFNEKLKTLCTPAEPEKLIDLGSKNNNLNPMGEFGSSIKWIYHEHGKLLRILGSGHMPSSYEGVPWREYADKFEMVIIGDSILSISDNLFYEEELLKDVYIGKNVTMIGSWAFENCSKLTELKIPDNVVELGWGIISGSGVKNLYIGKLVKSVYDENDDGFSECFVNSDSLTNITVSPQNKNFESDNGILYDEEKYELICYPASNPSKGFTLSNNTMRIREYAFYGVKNLKEIKLHENLEYIGPCAFSGCASLEKIKIPGNINTISFDMFSGCEKLKSVEIGNGVPAIGSGAFFGCSSLESIVIPSSVTHIYHDAFYNCISLKAVILPESLEQIDSCAFENCALLSSITIPANVNTIEENAFSGCTNLIITVDRYESNCDYSEEWYGDATVIYKEEPTNPLFPFLF